MTYDVKIGGRTLQVEVTGDPRGSMRVSIDGGTPREVASGMVGAAEGWLDEQGILRTVAFHLAGDVLTAQVRGHGLSGTVVDIRTKALAAMAGGSEGAIVTPMPGSVVRVLAAVGDVVSRGQVLVVVEAMKMENEFRAPVDGVVVEIAVTAGRAVDANTLLLRIEPTTGSGAP